MRNLIVVAVVLVVACKSQPAGDTVGPAPRPAPDAAIVIVDPRPDAAVAPASPHPVMADPCSDTAVIADTEAQGDDHMSAARFVPALASYERVVRCKPAALSKVYLAACRAHAFPKAQAYFSKFPADRREKMAEICIREGYDPRLQIAKSPDPCACENSVGVPIEETHCGYLICGTDRQVYRCGRHDGLTPWTLVQPVRQCAAPGRIQAEQAIQLGGDCSKGQACPAPSTCVSYLGIAGARGPTFKTCEIKCTKGTACPAGTSCITIADGPGQVCR